MTYNILTVKFYIIHWEIIFRLDPLNRSEFHLIYPDLFRNIPDRPLSAPTGSAFDQI